MSSINSTRKSTLTRRYLIKGLVTSACIPSFLSAAVINKTETMQLYSAATDDMGQHWLVIFDVSGRPLNQLALPSRAHQVFKHPFKPLICVVGRRPGRYLLLVHTNTGELIQTITPSQGHHFYGHGLFSHDGRYLVTTENHIATGEGRINVRDSETGFSIVKQYSSGGIGPHEIKLMPDGKTLVVANGGIKTHPDKGREKLNLDTMRPSLAYIDMLSGQLLEEYALPEYLHQLSIRHIDVNQHDQVVVAMQYQGDKTDQVPLLATHRRGQEIRPLKAPVNTYLAMKHYCGSVCFGATGNIAAATSPKGDRVTIWDINKETLVDELRCRDACGVAALSDDSFAITSGTGKVYYYSAEYTADDSADDQRMMPLSTLSRESVNSYQANRQQSLAWDNHLSVSV